MELQFDFMEMEMEIGWGKQTGKKEEIGILVR